MKVTINVSRTCPWSGCAHHEESSYEGSPPFIFNPHERKPCPECGTIFDLTWSVNAEVEPEDARDLCTCDGDWAGRGGEHGSGCVFA